MTEYLTRLLGRLPIGWLQLIHNRTRLAAAIAGVMFANILILMQLGFMGALIDSIALPYRAMHADIIVSSSDANTLADGSPLPRQRMFEALSVPGVASATPLYFGKMDWKQPDGTIRTLDVFGVDPNAPVFRSDALLAARDQLKLADVALIDRRTRNIPEDLIPAIEAGTPYTFEANSRTVTVVGAEGTMNMNTHSKQADELLRVIAETMIHPPSNEYCHGGEPWLIIGPEHADILKAGGYDKAAVKARLWELTKMPAGRMSVKDLLRVRESRGAEYGGKITDDTLLTIAQTPEDIMLMVAGGPGTHSIYVPSFGNAYAVTRAMEFQA